LTCAAGHLAKRRVEQVLPFLGLIKTKPPTVASVAVCRGTDSHRQAASRRFNLAKRITDSFDAKNSAHTRQVRCPPRQDREQVSAANYLQDSQTPRNRRFYSLIALECERAIASIEKKTRQTCEEGTNSVTAMRPVQELWKALGSLRQLSAGKPLRCSVRDVRSRKSPG
jgi:hypothetical protein